MTVTVERFAQGLTYAEYKEQMTRNRERLEANEASVVLSPDDVAFFAKLDGPIHALAIAEDWCGDVIANLPVLARLAAESGNIEIRVFLRDQNLDLIDQYLKDGQFRSIPVFVFFDAQFRELGHWIERPASVTALQAKLREDLFANDPVFAGIDINTPFGELPEPVRVHYMQANNVFREEQRAFSDNEVVREIRALVEQGIPQASEAPSAHPTASLPHKPAPSTATSGPIKVSITYCADCGYEPQTLALTSALIHEFAHDLASIELIPWQDGAFDVVVGGDLVHSMYRDGGFPENETIINAVRERLSK